MNPVTGVGGASPSDDGADQADSGVLQQVHILPGGELDVATTVTAASIIVATSSVVTTSTALTASATTSTVATTSVGKGGSGGRSNKGKGPASKRHAAASVLTTTHPVPAGTNPELSGPTSSVTTAVCTTTADLNFDVILASLIETARTRRAAADAADARASSVAAAAVRAHGHADSISDTDPELTSARARASADRHACDAAVRAAAARAAADDADFVVDQARVFAADLAQDRGADSLVPCPGGTDFNIILDSVVATARDCHATADVADARANSAAAVAADRADSAAAAVRALDVAHADSSTPDNDPGAVLVCARRARSRARAADSRSRTLATLAAAARDAAVAADIVVAQARAFAAGRVVVQDLAADSRVPSPGPDSSLIPPGFVDLFGFVVSLKFSEVVNDLISGVCILAKDIISYFILRIVSNILRNLSSSERRAWCLTNGKLYELKFVARCFAGYSTELLPTFLNSLRSVRTWDSSSRSLVLLTGDRLADFWVSLDEAIFKSITSFFMSRWCGLIDRFSVMSGPEEGSSPLCGGDFVNACARSDASLPSVSRFDSASEGMRVRVASQDGGSLDGGDFVYLFGFEVPPRVEEMVNVLICEVSALARRTYSSVVAVPVSSNMRELSSSEQCACLITNMMLYKTSFMHRFFLDYCGGLCSEFICSLFSVIPGDASGRRLLSLTGDSLRGFWISLSRAIMGVLQDVFAERWNALINQFSVLLGPGEESSSAVLCVGDFISAHDKVGVPDLAASGMRVLVTARRRAVSHVTEVTSGSSVADDVVSVSTPPPTSSSEMLVLAREEEVEVSEVEVSEVELPIVGAAVADLGVLEGESSGMTVMPTTSASPVTISVFEVEEFSTVPRIGSSGGPVAPKKLFMKMYSAGMSSSSMSSGSIVSSGPLSSLPVATGIGS
ncbi:hypothetical protein, partial [Candidatus Ichthyocystis sparus]|uniref:hypothetical protein n=1 Tax=Candidatus Ichthyocystis sparus TaxID=1561004 RepID=UPI00159EE251